VLGEPVLLKIVCLLFFFFDLIVDSILTERGGGADRGFEYPSVLDIVCHLSSAVLIASTLMWTHKLPNSAALTTKASFFLLLVPIATYTPISNPLIRSGPI
jgi:hypothetical protein